MPSQHSINKPFPTTRWTLVAKLDESVSEAEREAALSELCQVYWPPIYAFLRSKGNSTSEAEDLVQGFFADFLGREHFASVRPGEGKLRSYLLRSVSNFAHRMHRDQNRIKRGGDVETVSMDLTNEDGNPVILEPAESTTPDDIFERQWALTLLNRAVEVVAEEYEAKGKREVFDALRFVISNRDEKRSYAEVAKQLGSSENTIKVTALRLRERYQRTLRDVVKETLLPGESVDEEIRDLMGVFG